jgi:hypothetical protein
MEAAAKTSSDEREALLALFTALLRPLMPVALERGISAREISDAVRRAYVQVLERRMSGQDRQLSDARLALVAGLTRSEVQLFRDPRSKSPPPESSASQFQIMARLLTIWHTHPRFSGAYGLALDLDLESAIDASRRTFAELVETVSPGANSDTLLDELIATDSAEIVDNKTLRCRSRAALFGQSSNDVNLKQIDRASKCLEAAASSFAHILLQEEGGQVYFERMVVSNHPLSERSRNEFAAVAQSRGDSYVGELDSWIAKHTEPDDSPTSRHYGVGVFFFEESPTPVSSGDAQSRAVDSSFKRWNGSVREVDVLAPPASIKGDQGNSGKSK